MVAPEDQQSQQDRLSVHHGYLNCVAIHHVDLRCWDTVYHSISDLPVKSECHWCGSDIPSMYMSHSSWRLIQQSSNYLTLNQNCQPRNGSSSVRYKNVIVIDPLSYRPTNKPLLTPFLSPTQVNTHICCMIPSVRTCAHTHRTLCPYTVIFLGGRAGQHVTNVTVKPVCLG